MTDLEDLKISLKGLQSLPNSPKLPQLTPTSKRCFHMSEAYFIGKAKIKERQLLEIQTKTHVEEEQYLEALRHKANKGPPPKKRVYVTRDVLRKEKVREELRRLRRRFGETLTPMKHLDDQLKQVRRVITENRLKQARNALTKRIPNDSIVISPFLSARGSPCLERHFNFKLFSL